MKSFISIILLSIILTNCGFKPIYSTKNSNFEIVEIINKNENKNSFAIEKIITSLSNPDAVKKVKLELSYKQNFSIILNLVTMFKVINLICPNTKIALLVI